MLTTTHPDFVAILTSATFGDDAPSDWADECDAPADWDAGTITFDPYV